MSNTIQKTLVAWAFNHYIAYYYFDNININQLKVAFEKGEIELENLPIKPEALKHLKLPWNVVSGVVGKLSIKIPLLTLLTDPWVIKLNNLTVIVAPRSQRTACTQENDHVESSDDTNLNQHIESNYEAIADSEESKLAGFYASFSATVSSIVQDIFKNIRLEVETMTVLFENFKHRIVRLTADSLLLYRPEGERKITMVNVSIYMASRREDMLKINLTDCNLELFDVSTSLEINSEKDIRGTLHIVGSTTFPVAMFLLEDFRMLFFSAENQQDGSVFARITCNHFNRETLAWDIFLKPWPFNLSWDRRKAHTRISLTSDELADITISSVSLDLIDFVRKRFLSESIVMWPLAKDDSRARTRKAAYKSSPQDCKLIYYNHSTNLARQLAGRSTRQLFRDITSETNIVGPGMRLNLVDSDREPIADILFENVIVKSTTKAREQMIDCSIQDIRIENAVATVLDRATRQSQNPAFRLIMDRIIGKSFGTNWFKQVQISMCELVMNIEEQFFLRLVEFISSRKNRNQDENRVSKYYFDMLRIDLKSLRLSVSTSTSLPDTLQRLKERLGLKFYGFEDAEVYLSPYLKMNVSQTLRGVFDSVTRFYKRQISEQAPRIVGQQIQNYLMFHMSDLLSLLYDEVYNKLLY